MTASGSSFAAFLAASLGLEKVGDVSEPVASSYGKHIIKFESEAQAGEKDQADFADKIRDTLLSNKQNEKYETTLQGWIESSNIKSYPAKMGY